MKIQVLEKFLAKWYPSYLKIELSNFDFGKDRDKNKMFAASDVQWSGLVTSRDEMPETRSFQADKNRYFHITHLSHDEETFLRCFAKSKSQKVKNIFW